VGELGIILAAIFVFFIGCAAVVGTVADDATTEADTAASAPAAGDQPAPPAQEDNPAVSQGIGTKDAPMTSHSGRPSVTGSPHTCP
jgi:hypothetical protein